MESGKIKLFAFILAILIAILFFSFTVFAQQTMPSLGESLPPETLQSLEAPPEFYQNLQTMQTPYLYPNAEANPWFQSSWQQDYCNKTGMDFLVLIEPTACSPAVVRSDLLEEQDVPVLCRMTGVKINPLIQVPYIKSIVPVVENKSNEIAFVNFLPSRIALSYYAPAEKKRAGFEGVPTMNNLGYLWIQLKQQPSEEKMPNAVKANMSVKIRYDVARTYGINENQFVLPVLNQDEWLLRYKDFGFWHGKGYLRLQEITGLSSAKIAVYSNPRSAPIKIIELREGVEPQAKDEVMLPGFYCGAGVRLKLEKITTPSTKARVMVNGNELLLENNEDILDSGCKLTNPVASSSYSGSVTIWCPTESRTLTIKDYEAKIEVKDPESRTLTVTVGSNITLKDIFEKDKFKHFYVGFIGKEYSKEGFADFMILFSRGNKYEQISKEDKEKIISKIHEYIKSKRGATLDVAIMQESAWITELRNLFEDQKFAKDINFFVRKVGIDAELGDIPFKIISVTGPEQVSYTKEIETIYKESIQKWRDVAYAYSLKPSPEGAYYGVIALRSAAELAKFMHKRIDQAELLKELIDKYASSDEQEVINEVENAREELRRAVVGAGNRIASITRPTGSYFIELIAVEKPGIGSQEAQIEINDVMSRITLDDEIDGWTVVEIAENSITLRNISNYEETIATGNWKYLGDTKVKLVNTVLRKEAKVTVLPFEKERETIANFTVQIGIEKRAIKLSPEKTSELIETLNKQIASLEKIRDSLGKVVTTWKKACFAGASALWIKNFVTGLSGEAYARKIVMEPWTNLCSDSAYRKNINAKSVSDCYRINEQNINKDITITKNALSKTNGFIKSIKEVEGVTTKGGLLGIGKTINESKFMLEAQNKFPEELKGIEIYEERELRRISSADGKIEFCENGCVTYDNIDKLYEANPNVDKSKTAKLLEHRIYSNYVAGNLTVLYDNGRLFRDDVKDIIFNLEIYKECSSKTVTEVENSALCKSIVKEGYSKLKYASEQVQDLNTISTFKSQFGINPVVVRPKEHQILKAPVYSADSNFINNRMKFGSFAKMNVGDKYVAFSSVGIYYIAVVEPAGGRDFNIKRLYEVNPDGSVKNLYENTEKENALTKKLDELQIAGIEEIDPSLCNNNEMKTPYRNEIKFWESGPYSGFVALMPIDVRAGWYMATNSYSGLEGAMVAWKENADINTFWICNVGLDGVPNFDYSSGPKGDDCCTQVVLATGAQYEIAGCTTPACSSQLIEKAKTCARNAITEFAAAKRTIDTKGCGKFNLGKPPSARATAQCEDYMSPTDCKIMYNLCDPVMCPASRCDFGGRMPVDNVIQSGIVGSMLLCWPNFEDGRGVFVPICLTGVHAGLDSFIGILKSGRDCLEEQLKSGKTIGICDQIMSIYKCEFFWKQLDPLLKAGIPALVESLGTRGGGEYALFSESWKQSVDAARYFTDFYAVSSVKAFKARSTAQIGTEICKRYVSAVYPTQAQFWEEISKPESPTQATACFQEIAMGGASPNSHYKVFAYIFAGRDQGVYYSIYLRRPAKPGYYEQFIPEEYLVKDGYGFLPAGQYLSLSPDFTAPSGYKEICIRLNEKEICNFADCASTSFAINELQNYYLESQLDKEVTKAKDCVSGKPTIFPTATLNIQSAVEHALEPQLYRRGIIRICSTRNPGESTEPERYKKIGYCDNREVGCWLDMNSVNESVSDLGIRAEIIKESEEKDIAWAIEKFNLSKPEESQTQLDNLEPKLVEISREVDNFIKEIKTKTPTQLESEKKAIEGKIKQIDDKINNVISEFNSIKDKCARSDEKARAEFNIAKLYDLRARLYAQPEVYAIDLKRAETETCEGRGGSWMSIAMCPENYEDITEQIGKKDRDEHPNEKCCRHIVKLEALELLWPVPEGHITDYFGVWREKPKPHSHKGIDIGAPKGALVLAAAPGIVSFNVVNDCYEGDTSCGDGYGNKVSIEHKIGDKIIYTFYGHMKEGSVKVKPGDSVKAGDPIGEIGNTGYSKGNHLHFEVRLFKDEATAAVDPLCFFSYPDRVKAKVNEQKIDQKKCKEIYEQLGVSRGTVKTKASSCYILNKEQCSSTYNCWWDSLYNRCKDCPDKCEGNTRGFGVLEWITFWNEGPNENDLIFRTKDDCEKNNCGFNCLWLNNKCQSLNEKTIQKKLEESLTAEELRKIKNYVENNKALIKQADNLLNEINAKLSEIAPQPSKVFLVHRTNEGLFTINNELVNYDDEVEICAVIETSSGYYSFDNFRLGNRDVKKYTGTTPSFEWYNINPIFQPFELAGEVYWLPLTIGAEGKAHSIQYKQLQISGNSWCIKANKNAGTYWYRVEVVIDGNVYSSLGRPASEVCLTNRQLCVDKYAKEGVNFDMYSGYESTVLEPDAFENGGISRFVHRISRKSDYYKYCDFNKKRCEFISTIEAFKNVPFAYGCSYYSCETPPEQFRATGCPVELRHLSEDFIAIDCINLALFALSITTGKSYSYSSFDNFIRHSTSPIMPQQALGHTSLSNILNANLIFKNNEQVEVGDILFLWDTQKREYSHTFILYKDNSNQQGLTGTLDGNDIVVYTSYVCPGSEPFNRNSKKDYDGQLCYAPLGRYIDKPNVEFSVVKVNDLNLAA